VTFVDGLTGETVRTTEAKQIVEALSRYRSFVEGSGKTWKIEEGLQALQIKAGWLADGFSLSVIRFFLFNRHSPQTAFPGSYLVQPAWWVDVSSVLDGVFGLGF
jgi:hypothetical protein